MGKKKEKNVVAEPQEEGTKVLGTENVETTLTEESEKKNPSDDENASKIYVSDTTETEEAAKEPAAEEQPQDVETVAAQLVKDEEAETEVENLKKTIDEELKPIDEINDGIKAVEAKLQEANTVMAENPEKAADIIDEEIKKVEKLEEKTEKIINKPRKTVTNVTTWWNGMGYDF